jgi:hypothetical protein
MVRVAIVMTSDDDPDTNPAASPGALDAGDLRVGLLAALAKPISAGQSAARSCR